MSEKPPALEVKSLSREQKHSVGSLSIAGRQIASDEPPFIIAEMSANHGGDLDRAIRIIRLAAEAGADAIKFQAYTADSLTLNLDRMGFVIEGDNPWRGEKLYDLYARAATPYDWFPDLYGAAKEAGIIPFSSPFDTDAVEMLEKLNSPAYKIASFEAVDVELIACCAETGKPLIISTGMASEDEIETALSAARGHNNDQIVLLKCTSAYPSDPREANLATISAMSERFGVPVGLSDHTLGTSVPVAACALGAVAVEKHFIDSRVPETADSAFSVLPDTMKRIVAECREAWEATGNVHYGPAKREARNLAFRRSLYVTAPVTAGAVFTRQNIRSIRPGYGLPVKCIDQILGRRAAKDLEPGTPLSWDVIE